MKQIEVQILQQSYVLTCPDGQEERLLEAVRRVDTADRKSTRLNSSHLVISYAVFCLKKKNQTINSTTRILRIGCELTRLRPPSSALSQPPKRYPATSYSSSCLGLAIRSAADSTRPVA